MIVSLTACSRVFSGVGAAACLTLSFTLGSVLTANAAVHEDQPIRWGKCESISEAILLVSPVPNEAREGTAAKLWMREMSSAVRQKYGDHGSDAMPVIERSVADADDFRGIVQSLVDSCRRIKFLGILGHGSAGYLQLGQEGVTLENIASVFGNGMQDAMAQDASICILACNVGGGCGGARFLLRIAAELLPKGGVISAPEEYVLGNALLRVAPRPVYGGYRELQVDPGALHPRWVGGTNPGPECTAR